MLYLILVVALASFCVPTAYSFDFHNQTINGYVNVRPNAHMFWWLFYASDLTESAGFVKKSNPEKFPIVIWLQGGPGGSSTGFGAFELIGPIDTELKTRNSSWLSHVNLLFIDNPVGTGFSYVTSNDAFATDNQMIAHDLMSTLKTFYSENKRFQNSELYIFSESYGGKMAVSLAKHLYEATQKHDIKCNFKGLVLGAPWISPIDSILTWPEYLQSFSLLDQKEYDDLRIKVDEMKGLLEKKEFVAATKYWSYLEWIIRKYTFNINFYNVMVHDIPFADLSFNTQKSQFLHNDILLYKLGFFYQEDLDDFMNGQIKSILSIPESVIWGSQIADVFKNLLGDFMKPVTHELEYILEKIPIKVVVYNGQFDLIVNILGTTKWMSNLSYSLISNFKSTPKNIFQHNNQVLGYYKSYDKLSFYWVLNSGHMVPKDAPNSGIHILLNTLKHNKSQRD